MHGIDEGTRIMSHGHFRRNGLLQSRSRDVCQYSRYERPSGLGTDPQCPVVFPACSHKRAINRYRYWMVGKLDSYQRYFSS
jgi:hypothetical protein